MPKKINPAQYLYVFECCVMTKGHLRSIIIDTQRDNFHFIPNDLYNLLDQYQHETISLILEKAGPGNKQTVIQYIDFLLEKELVYLSDHKIPLKKIQREYHYPFPIQNVVIDLRSDIKIDLGQVLSDLESLYAAHIQFRIYDNTRQLFSSLLKFIGINTFERVEIIANYTDDDTFLMMQREMEINPYISLLKVYSHPRASIQPNSSKLMIYEHHFSMHSDCGTIGADYFMTRLYHIVEGNQHNTCLYKKISIDENGFIRHCPSMKKDFGRYSKENILRAITDKEYISTGNLTKNEINTCKICEFRDICTDCRAHLTDPDDLLSRPLKCSYDPLNGRWGLSLPSNKQIPVE